MRKRLLRAGHALAFARLFRQAGTFPTKFMRVRILYHDHCFDGAASAAYFTRFMQGAFYPDAEYVYTGMAHKASQLFEDGLFDGDVNAIVDFKYSSDPRLTWWFDHHQSAFLTPRRRREFPPGSQRPQALRSFVQILHLVHLHRRQGPFRFRRARSGATGPLGQHHRRRAISGRQDRRRTGRAGHEADAGDRRRQRVRDHPEGDRLDAAPQAGGDRRGAGDPGAVRSRSTSATWNSWT